MPYCPKCDMEFVDGITVCTDCGGPLVESQEAAEAMKREAREKEEQERAAWVEAALLMAREAADKDGSTPDGSAGDGMEETGPPQTDGGSGIPARPEEAVQRSARVQSRVYVTKRQRCEDMLSSVSAFLLVGGIFLICSILNWVGIIRLPLSSGSGLIFQIALAAIGAGCLFVAGSSHMSAKKLAREADEEDVLTGEIIDWFVKTYPGEELDAVLLEEDPSLSGNELELKRFDLIQDRLITSRDLPDPSYVDALCEEIYERVYEQTEAAGAPD